MIDIKNIKLPSFQFLKKKWFIISLSSVVVLALIGLLWGLSLRGSMLEKAISKVKTKLKTDYALNLEIGQYGFSGLATVDFKRIKLIPDSSEQLAAIDEAQVSINLFPLLSGEVQLGDLKLLDADFTLVKKDSSSNYDFIFRKSTRNQADTLHANQATLAEKVDRLLQQVFLKIPQNLTLKDVSLSYQDSSSKQVVIVPNGIIDDGDYDIDVFLNEQEAKWNFKGAVNPSRETLNVTISSENKDAEIPFINKRLGLKVSFDEMSFHLDEVSRKGKEFLQISGGWDSKNLKVYHRRLSEEQILVPQITAQGGLLISENTLELVKGTDVQVKEFAFQPQIKYARKPNRLLSLAVHTGKFEAQHFFDAIPKGLFENLDDIQVEGQINYDMDFQVDLDKPDELKFSSSIDDSALRIKKWGKADVASLVGPVVYEAYEDTLKMRDILLSSTNPQFTPLNQIAPILKKTVLNTEDPYFYDHKGFELEAFQLSLITNIKENKFKRGASTISMQLVKNLFLNRNKTMMRKFEEILLVWLMEQSNQVSKDRLFEIYLNIIEWGKNVYGIKEAAQYYFGKSPADLQIGESLYLSSIIPRPKTGLSSFDYTGHLKPWVLKHFNTYGYIMTKRNQLEGESVPANYGFYEVELQQGLRPARPKGLTDSMMTHDDIKDMVDEIDQEEAIRRTLIERLLGREPKTKDN